MVCLEWEFHLGKFHVGVCKTPRCSFLGFISGEFCFEAICETPVEFHLRGFVFGGCFVGIHSWYFWDFVFEVHILAVCFGAWLGGGFMKPPKPKLPEINKMMD